MNAVFRSMSRTDLALFERRAALYFPHGLSSPSQVHRKHGFVSIAKFSKLRIDFDNDRLISFLGWQAQKRSKLNSPGSPAGSHGSATAGKMVRSLNLIEPDWFRHQNKDKLQREITFFFKDRGFYLVLVISRRCLEKF